MSSTTKAGPEGGVAVAGRGLSIAFDGTLVLDRVDLTIVLPGELVISGRSGSGKTSLLLVLAGLVPPSAGTVTWPGLAADATRRREQIALVFQAPSLIPELSAAENVRLPLRLRGRTRDESVRAAAEALEQVGLSVAHGEVLPSEMSGGEQQRVSVARALATRPRLLLADEPTGALDRTNAAAVIAALRTSVERDGASLVVSTHDEDVAGNFAAHLAVENQEVRWVRP
jgi:ABC-type lipoprotein export system ATPase subunit